MLAGYPSKPLVLIVDADATGVHHCGRLRLDGYEVETACDIRTARTALKHRPIDLVLVHVHVLDGDGVRLLREVRAGQETRSIPIAILTGDRIDPTVCSEAAGLCTRLVVKPSSGAALSALVASLLDQSVHQHPSPRQGTANGRPRILIIDDNADARAMMMQLLAFEGFLPEGAPNGRVALDQMRTGPLPQVIVLDLMMPIMDGWTFCAHQRRDPELAQIPVVVLSAEPRETLGGLRVAAVFEKPCNHDQLVCALRALC
jgi:DNA-binding response OmpR family regulator